MYSSKFRAVNINTKIIEELYLKIISNSNSSKLLIDLSKILFFTGYVDRALKVIRNIDSILDKYTAFVELFDELRNRGESLKIKEILSKSNKVLII